jgi:amino acid transporter
MSRWKIAGKRLTARAATGPVRFGTYTGVFTPTLLTIFGVIMYVRLPWVVGNAGLLGAWLIMALAIGITLCTGLSLASIATNTRIGHGGAYTIIQKGLGSEVGGSVGIPLYLTRPLGTAMYIFGFREGWLWIFPDHPALAIDLSIFLLLFALAYRGADVAFRVQHLIMAIVVLSLLSIGLSPSLRTASHATEIWGSFPGFPEQSFGGVSPWVVFAVFFPATTGILAGANMSGDLKDPRRSIAEGTLWAIGVSSAAYVVLAWAAARMAPPSELLSNYNVFIDHALWPPAVLAGLLGATFSSALAGSVGGPRMLMAMAHHRVVPASAWLGRMAPDGEPRNATLVTGVLTLAALMMRDLNVLAPLLTMFFLITYSVINLVLLVETLLGLVSFRPTLRVPWVVPLLGTVGGVFAMFIVNPTFGLVSSLMVVAIYVWIQRMGAGMKGEGVRSSLFVALAEWAAAKVSELDQRNVRAWKPNLLIPFENPAHIRGDFPFLLDITKPEGSVKLLGISMAAGDPEFRRRVVRLSDSFRRKHITSNWAVVESSDFTSGLVNAIEALQSAFFRPNTLFLSTESEGLRSDRYAEIVRATRLSGVGVLLLSTHPRARLGLNGVVNVWIREQDTPDIDVAFSRNNLNLSLLMAYRLARSWDAEINLVTLVEDSSRVASSEIFLAELMDLARLPERTRRHVIVGRYPEDAVRAPLSDLAIVGMPEVPDFAAMADVVMVSRASCLFVLDSGMESARA